MRRTWGRVGARDAWTALSLDGESGDYGLEREVAPGVGFRPFPQANVQPKWERDVDDKLLYRLRFPNYDQPEEVASQNLQELQELLRGEAAGATPKEPTLARLNHLGEQLLLAAEAVHADGDALGQLTPENVFLVGTDRPRVFLPDAGFVWRNRFGPKPPGWLTPDAATESYWELSPKQINQALKDRAEPLQRHDLRVIARLFAFLLVGPQTLADWSPAGPLTFIPRKSTAPQTAAEVWALLDDVLESRGVSATAFREQLQATGGLASHFDALEAQRLSSSTAAAPKRSAFPGRSWMVMVAPLLIAAALLGAMWGGGNRVAGTQSILCPNCTERSELFTGLLEFENALRQGTDGGASLEEQAQRLGELHGVPRSGIASLQQIEEECLDRLRQLWLDRIAEEKELLVARLSTLPYDAKSECEQIDQILTPIDRLVERGVLREEPEWCGYLRVFRKQLGGS